MLDRELCRGYWSEREKWVSEERVHARVLTKDLFEILALLVEKNITVGEIARERSCAVSYIHQQINIARRLLCGVPDKQMVQLAITPQAAIASIEKMEQYAMSFHYGDEQALAFFYEQLLPSLSVAAFRFTGDKLLAEELASDAMVSTWKMRHKLNRSVAIRSYAYACVRYASIRAVRDRKKKELAERKVENTDILIDTPYHHAIRAEVYRVVHESLKHLPEATRTVMIMHYLEGKTTGQIAKELNRAPSTVKTQKALGLASLRKRIPRLAFLLFAVFPPTFFHFV